MSVNPSWQMMWSVSSEIPNPQIGGKVNGKVKIKQLINNKNKNKNSTKRWHTIFSLF